MVQPKRGGLRRPTLAQRVASVLGAVTLLAVFPWSVVAQTPQNPSPMVERTRAHERLVPLPLDGVVRSFDGPGGSEVDVFVPDRSGQGEYDLFIHFHGASWLVHQAVAGLGGDVVAVSVNAGSGSAAYGRMFDDPAAFDALLTHVQREVETVAGSGGSIRALVLSAFSAGYGAVRALLRTPRHGERVSAVLLLDGMHASYVPAGTPLAAGGEIDTLDIGPFATYARAALRGERRFIITHSEVFPGTFASTTETADWLLDALGLMRTAVLRWGPRGMQQLSETKAEGFELHSYAGNSAPDHLDHLHALPEMLERVERRLDSQVTTDPTSDDSDG